MKKLVGEDRQGNKFFISNENGNEIRSAKLISKDNIDREWRMWLHYLYNYPRTKSKTNARKVDNDANTTDIESIKQNISTNPGYIAWEP